MNDTPETDKEHQTMPMGGFTLDFARKLERERDEAIRSCHIWQKGHSDIVTERDLWQQEAKRWKIISQTQTIQHYANPN
jgi:hypothetical protein